MAAMDTDPIGLVSVITRDIREIYQGNTNTHTHTHA